MDARPYTELSPVQLFALCIWREARGESEDGKRGVAHVIANRVNHPGWWGHDWCSVILKPWQFSSFNKNDPNSEKWPEDTDPSWQQCLSIASDVYLGMNSDPTDGACYYYDTSIEFPRAWGPQSEYTNTLNIGRLKFWRRNLPTNLEAVQDAAAGE